MRTSTIAITGQALKIAELYELTLTNGVTYYYTTHDKAITWGSPSHVYSPAVLQRNAISAKTNLEPTQVDIIASNISGELYTATQLNLLDGAQIVIKRLVYTDSYAAGKDITIFVGTVDVEFNRQVLKMICTSFFDTLNILVPHRVYQEPCNNQFCDTQCTLSRNSYKTSTTASGDADDLFTVKCVGLTVPSAGYYDLGAIEITTGTNAGQKRMVRTVDLSGVIYVVNPFPYKVLSGVGYDIFAGCDKKITTCKIRFGVDNTDNFTGFLYIPQPEQVGI